MMSESSKRHSKFLSLIFILKCLSKASVIRISKSYFQILFSSCVTKSAQKFTDLEIASRTDACNVSSIKVNLDVIVSRSRFEPML